MTGAWIVLAAVVLALAFGGYRRLTDGRVRPVATDVVRDRVGTNAHPERPGPSPTHPDDRSGPRLDAARLGAGLGSEATFVQFSSQVCAPCRTTRTLLTEVTAARPSVTHIDIDAEDRLDLVEEFGVTRTPTVLLLDASGAVRHRILGAARPPEVLDALDQLAGPRAA